MPLHHVARGEVALLRVELEVGVHVAAEGKVLVVDDVQLSEPSTKTFASLLNACGASGKVLFIQADANPAVVKSGRNIAGVTMSTAGTLGTYDIIAHDILVLTSASVEALSKVHGG